MNNVKDERITNINPKERKRKQTQRMCSIKEGLRKMFLNFPGIFITLASLATALFMIFGGLSRLVFNLAIENYTTLIPFIYGTTLTESEIETVGDPKILMYGINVLFTIIFLVILLIIIIFIGTPRDAKKINEGIASVFESHFFAYKLPFLARIIQSRNKDIREYIFWSEHVDKNKWESFENEICHVLNMHFADKPKYKLSWWKKRVISQYIILTLGRGITVPNRGRLYDDEI